MNRLIEVSSADNPVLARVRRLLRDPGSYRRLGQVWLEGEHLLAALVARGWLPEQVVVGQSGWADTGLRQLVQQAPRVLRVPDAMLAGLSGLETPPRVGALIACPAQASLVPGMPSVVLDRIQDAGNVGSILRSAAALGIGQVLAMKGTAALWSPKVLRAAQGAHFGLRLCEGITADDLPTLGLPLVGTALQADALLPQAPLPWPCAWVLGHEGQGIAAALLARCALTVRIPQPGGEDSLNVAAAAAVCFYESLRRRQAS